MVDLAKFLDKENLKKLLKEYLTINITESKEFGGHYVKVSIAFDGEKIDEDSINIDYLK